MASDGFHRRVQRAVQRVAQRGIILRKADDVPELGRLDRVRQAPRTESDDPAQRTLDPDSARRERLRRAITLGWSLALGLSATAAVVVSFVLWVQPILNRAKDTTERDRLAFEARVRKISKFKSPTEDEALALVRRVLEASTDAEVLRVIRTGALKPAEVLELLAAMRKADGAIKEMNWLGSIDKNGLSLEGVELMFDEQDKTKNRLAILTPDDQGIWKMDFAAFARIVNPPWAQLLGPSTEPGMVRMWVVRDRYFNFPFVENEWVSFKMASQEMDETLIGYCKKGSAQHRAMASMWKGADNSTVRATLMIRRKEDAERVQFEITQVLAEDWVMSEKPFDELMGGGK